MATGVALESYVTDEAFKNFHSYVQDISQNVYVPLGVFNQKHEIVF